MILPVFEPAGPTWLLAVSVEFCEDRMVSFVIIYPPRQSIKLNVNTIYQIRIKALVWEQWNVLLIALGMNMREWKALSVQILIITVLLR